MKKSDKTILVVGLILLVLTLVLTFLIPNTENYNTVNYIIFILKCTGGFAIGWAISN